MDTSVIDLDTKLVVVYYNGGKPNLLCARNDATLFGLNGQLDQINSWHNHKDTRSVDGIEYQCPLID